ncbi:GCN5 family acetyltransferase [Planomonospora sphaerica]|uniref:GCN5 family acetyltransferase n=1 Tax=Planomonospora sphaerica TaxID=161355 RepID=A0A171DR35_9ACTN|nr:GNAT family N-acetyltransferase [Planomonospora sphaerica]GAT71512.1 GCN5 family acetyltransferase [Planomonospora sphaerica]
MTVPTASPALPVPLAGGLVLRQAQPADLDQIGTLLAERGEPADALDHRLVATDPDAGWPACAVVVDGDRVVSTATLLDEEVRIADIRLPSGQVELVATDREYEGRGLVRALMRWAHDRSAARGHVIQAMIGIPYFYRLFGYEYAVDIPPALTVHTPPPGEATPGLRPARPSDIPVMAALQETAQSRFDVAMPHSPACWRWLLAHEASTLWVLEHADTVIATGRTTPPEDDGLLLAEAAALDEAAARELLRGVAALVPDGQVRVVHRAGTVTAAAWHDFLTHEPRRQAEQYYIRIPDVTALLDRLRPLLWHRLTAAGIDHTGRDIVISTFGAHYRIPVHADGLGAVTAGGAMQGPAAVGGAGVAPDYLPALLFGPHGIEGLTRIRPDVYTAQEELFQALFPPLTADVLSYYLPY